MRDIIALSFLPIWRWRRVSQLLRHGTTPAEILDAQCRERADADPERHSASALRERALQAIDRARVAGLWSIPWDDPRYPPSLLTIIDPPPVLWIRGQTDCFCAPAVAIVGSRAGSPYALSVAERLGGDLAAQGVTVVSGLARGVDAAAHQGALAAGGLTLAVLGCGADLVYPREHEALARQVAVAGALLSEFAPGTPPHPRFFPRRNRLISGLSRAVVVVEAGEKSGSLITARCALEQGRDVLAVPGNVLNGRNRGGHALLRDGARLVETAEDVLDELGLAGCAGMAIPKGAATDADALSADPVLRSLMDREAVGLDQISANCGLPAARLLPRLLDLELQGLVRRVGGGRFVRV